MSLHLQGTHNRIHSLPIKLSIALPLIIYANVIERKAIELLNSRSTIAPVPSLGNDKGAKKYMVAGSKASLYKVFKTEKGKVTCNCKGFKFASICKHSVAVAEKEGTLATVIKNAKLARIFARYFARIFASDSDREKTDGSTDHRLEYQSSSKEKEDYDVEYDFWEEKANFDSDTESEAECDAEQDNQKSPDKDEYERRSGHTIMK
eukprot:gene11178-20119_t